MTSNKNGKGEFDEDKAEAEEFTDSELDEDFDLELEEELDEEGLEEETPSEIEEAEEEVEEVEEEAEEEEHVEEGIPSPKKAIEKPAKKKAVTVEDIPLSIIVEVGRLQLTAKQLMELQPGNLLELDIRPENGVDLIINGKKVAKAELLRIGETIGVRILDIL